jgi:PadR family transcriptional regulator, regulatory protein PadR
MGRLRNPSAQAQKLFAALAVKPRAWRYGYSLMQETGLTSGTLYPLLIRLAEAGLLETEWQEPEKEGRPPRHAYRLTTEGRARAHALVAATTSRRHGLAEA